MAYVSNTFAIDPPTVEESGRNIANQATDDLGNAFTLVYAVLDDTDSMPTMFTAALTTFHDNLNFMLSRIINQRYDIGQALQGAATATEKTDLANASSFIWSRQSGWTSYHSGTV